MLKWQKWWPRLLFAAFCVIIGLNILVVFWVRYAEQNAKVTMQEFTWAIAPQEEKIEYRRYGFDVCTRRNDNGTVTMSLKKPDGTVVTSHTAGIYGNGSPIGWLDVNNYGIVDSGDGASRHTSYAGMISLDDMPQYTFYNTNPGAPLCLKKEEEQWGYVNRQGFWMIQPENYEDATQFNDRHAVVRTTSNGGNSYLYILNLDGTLSPCEFRSKGMEFTFFDSEEIVDDMLLLQKRSRYYFLNVAENAFIPEKAGYDDAAPFSDGLAAVKEDGLWGYIDKTGQYVIPPRYSDAFGFSNGYAYVIDQSGQPLVIDRTGEVISSKIGTDTGAGGYADGFLQTPVGNGRCNLVDLEGKLYLPNDGVEYLEYQDGVWITDPLSYHEGVFLPQCRKYILGNTVYASESVVIVNSDHKGALYDKFTGKALYRCKHISQFSEGFAVATKSGGKQTYIDTQGRELFSPRMVKLGDFSDGLASVTLVNGQTGMIANPLIYDAWTADENARATALGIEPVSSEFLHYGELWDRLAVVSDRVYAACTAFQMGDAACYQVDVGAIRSALEREGYPSEGVVDREHLAVALKALATEYGIVTDGFLMFYDDKDEVTESCKSAMAYISTLCLFDMEGTSILPQKQVSASEGQAYLLRFFERMIEQTEQ